MKNYYEILGVHESYTVEEIKKEYQKKILQCHPDKSPNGTAKEFQLIQHAWETLRDANLRKEYDRRLLEIDLDDMEMLEEGEYFHSCRCGGDGFRISEKELEEGVERVACATCSLMIKVIYEEA